MYLRRTQRRRKDGSVVGYLGLAHNRRVDGVTRAEVLLNLGREDELDVEALRRLAASITRFTDGDSGGQPLGSGDGDGAGDGDLEVASSQALGGVWLLDALWRRDRSPRCTRRSRRARQRGSRTCGRSSGRSPSSAWPRSSR
jgi:hypothetical protein